ncbi:MMPL family transporter [Nesterenkonia sp. HG001]|uniref:MMPL family transporter n=1 Tax=Nesterenkonia sp. HG001 TaxID=2983207 RepID=UPI002AC7DCF2|nr:MMPL family transporter [Nesterenkonia sp. HG001]MDZ5077528.1 MMPL family transporter [Nesterenkonia sp. HG001]
MARLLHRLGLFAARRAKTVIAAWFAVLAIAVTSFLSFGGQLTDQITLPDLETTRVADRLAEELPDAGGGSAIAVLQTEDGGSFTEEQRDAVAGLSEDLEALDPVNSVTDPFVSAQERAEGEEELTEARQELVTGQEELEAGREEVENGYAELDSGQQQLDEAQEELDDAFAQAPPGGHDEATQAQLDATQAELDAQQAELDAGREELDAAQDELESGEEEMASGERELERGEQMMELTDAVQTVSADEDVAILTVNFHEELQSVGTGDLTLVSDELAETQIDGVEILPSSDLAFEMPHLFSTAEAIGLMIAAVVLLVMLGTFIGAGLPLLNALIGVGIGVAGAMSLSGFVDMMSVTPILGLMLGLAVGIDYALFILHRHRNQMKDGMELRASIALANGTAGNAVVFAGATVIIALLALNVTGIGFLGLMGSIAAVCVFIAVLMAVTMTPATLSLTGRRILARRERRYIGLRKARRITEPMKTPRALGIAALALVGLAVLAIPTFSMRLGLPDASSESADSSSYQAYVATEEAFGAGQNGPLLMVADLPEGLSAGQATDLQIALAQELDQRDDVAAVVPAAINESDDVAVFQVIPEDGPASESVEQLVHDLRGDEVLTGEEFADVEVSVAGMTAANIDISEVIADALPLYLVVVVGLSLLLMIMVFRSILLPVVATLGFVGSFAAGLGGVVAVFQWGWLGELFGITEPGPILTFLPIIMVGILFGLAMDYQLFTGSGMREAYAHGDSARLAVRKGLHAGRSVVTAAALIMGSVFAGFIFTDDPMVTSIGLALALGVLLDAFVVRLVLVPALLHLAGPAAWWLPKWLDRLLPDVDVEGSALERQVMEVEDWDGADSAEQDSARVAEPVDAGPRRR